MLKNKVKLLLSIIMIICLALSPLSYADDEATATTDKAEIEASNEATKQTTAQENTSNSEETTPTDESQHDEDTHTETEHQNDVKTGDVYLTGDIVNIDYIIDGNLYVLANELNIDSQVVGNVFVVANKVTLKENGYIGASIYALGSDIELSGVVFDAYISSSSLSIPGYIYRDVHCASDKFNLSGVIGRNANITSNTLNFEKTADDIENAQSPAGQCKVMGSLTYNSEKEAQIPENVIDGNVSFNQFMFDSSSNITDYLISAITSIVFVIAIWGLFKWLGPKFIDNADKKITTKPFKTIGLGLLGLICIPVVSVLLLIAGVTSSFGLLLFTTYFILIFVGRAVSIIAINNIIAKKVKFDTTIKSFILLLVTSCIAWATTLIPVASGLFGLVFVVLGMGIIIRSLVSKDVNNLTEKKESKN